VLLEILRYPTEVRVDRIEIPSRSRTAHLNQASRWKAGTKPLRSRPIGTTQAWLQVP